MHTLARSQQFHPRCLVAVRVSAADELLLWCCVGTDLTLVSIVMGKLFDTFHDYPELRQNRIDYAKKHGYNYCEMRSAAAPPHTDRSANWNKFPLSTRLI